MFFNQKIHQFHHQNKKSLSFVQPDPLQLSNTGEHSTLRFRHVHLKVLNSVWQLHLITLRSSSGAGGKSVCTGMSLPSRFSQPHSNGLSSLLSIPVPESRHKGCNTLQQLKWVVKFVDESVKHL